MSNLLQNRLMIDYADIVIIFVDLYLRNTDYLVNYAKQHGKIHKLVQAVQRP
jgi:hypothetical protein